MRTIRLGLLVFAFTSVLGLGHAHAQDGRPLYVGFGLGPTIGLGGGGVAFKLEESIGYHVLSPGRHPGLFVGGVLGESFAGGATTLALGARAGFDAQIFESRKLSLLVTPHMTVGASVGIVNLGDGSGRSASGAFDLGFAGELRLVIADGSATVWVRPLGIDLHISGGVAAQYDLLVGASYNF